MFTWDKGLCFLLRPGAATQDEEEAESLGGGSSAKEEAQGLGGCPWDILGLGTGPGAWERIHEGLGEGVRACEKGRGPRRKAEGQEEGLSVWEEERGPGRMTQGLGIEPRA